MFGNARLKKRLDDANQRIQELEQQLHENATEAFRQGGRVNQLKEQLQRTLTNYSDLEMRLLNKSKELLDTKLSMKVAPSKGDALNAKLKHRLGQLASVFHYSDCTFAELVEKVEARFEKLAAEVRDVRNGAGSGFFQLCRNAGIENIPTHLGSLSAAEKVRMAISTMIEDAKREAYTGGFDAGFEAGEKKSDAGRELLRTALRELLGLDEEEEEEEEEEEDDEDVFVTS